MVDIAASIDIRRDNRVCFFGRSGSGKTTLARAFLNGVSNFVVLDPKHTFRMTNVPIRRQFSTNDRRHIVRELNDEWEPVLRGALKKKNIVVYIDEGTLVNEGYGYKPSPMLGRVIRTGRETNVAAWIGSQRPKDIPSAVFTEAEHFFVFQLNWSEDRKKVVSFTHDKMAPLLDSLKGHEFVYYNVLTNALLKGKLREASASRY